MEEFGAVVVSSLLVLADHEIVSIGTVPNGGLLHDTEVVPVLEYLLAAFLCVDANDLRCLSPRCLEVILLEHTITLYDSPCGTGSNMPRPVVWPGQTPLPALGGLVHSACGPG